LLENLFYYYIVSSDIKASNILLTQHAEVKIGDFGVSKQSINKTFGKSLTKGAGTLLWMAPEILNGGGNTSPSDIWLNMY
jgi:serine/threonine protein kinase